MEAAQYIKACRPGGEDQFKASQGGRGSDMTRKVGGETGCGPEHFTAELLGLSQPPSAFTENSQKKRNHPVSCSCAEDNGGLLSEVRMGRRVEDHRKETGS